MVYDDIMYRYTKAIILSALSLLIIGSVSTVVLTLNNHDEVAITPQTVIAPQPPTIPELLKLVNEERSRVGVAPLIEDTRLDQSAQRKADDEVKYNYFGHISPNDGKHGYEYINDVGIYCKTDAENLIENIDSNTGITYENTSKGTIDGWIKSPPHYAAMINKDYSLTGFGISGTQIVEHFCQQ